MPARPAHRASDLVGSLISGADPSVCAILICPRNNATQYLAALDDGIPYLFKLDGSTFGLSGFSASFIANGITAPPAICHASARSGLPRQRARRAAGLPAARPGRRRPGLCELSLQLDFQRLDRGRFHRLCVQRLRALAAAPRIWGSSPSTTFP
jgi:hypothetical protein